MGVDHPATCSAAMREITGSSVESGLRLSTRSRRLSRRPKALIVNSDLANHHCHRQLLYAGCVTRVDPLCCDPNYFEVDFSEAVNLQQIENLTGKSQPMGVQRA
jgi:hypothetical protein